jgi:hypothetical protein
MKKHKAPVSWSDWKQIWDSHSMYFGWCLHSQIKHHGRFVWTREMWQIQHRLNRIESQMHEAWERCDRSVCEAILDVMTNGWPDER